MWPFNKKTKKHKFIPKKYVIFNVDTFNVWFNDSENGALYANPGIFLRLDKLDHSQIEDYLIKCHGLNLSELNIEREKVQFLEDVRRDWIKKLNKR